MPHVFCLDCDRKIMLHTDISVGDQVACSSCDSEFQIIGLSPIEIEWLYDDYDDDDYSDNVVSAAQRLIASAKDQLTTGETQSIDETLARLRPIRGWGLNFWIDEPLQDAGSCPAM